ncbi:hypothetical protein F8388_010489 [Cannabis sativa]|uniref:Uncharacterized protein n=1 Tax=Cannabis sativa TaxID=3483 RepID=A0A7J6GSM2_CANSA|nr:hypothetical protein F8388_010489 [Cannabis sativa]
MNCFEIYAFSNGVKFVANAQALLLTGSANSAKASGSSARPNGSKLPPGYNGSVTSPSGPPPILYPSTAPIKITCVAQIAKML